MALGILGKRCIQDQACWQRLLGFAVVGERDHTSADAADVVMD